MVQHPPPDVIQVDVPSTSKIVKATVAAAVVAALILVTVILPAEYGLDPLGTGEMLGLTSLGQTEETTQTAAPTVLNTAAQPGGHNAQGTDYRTESVEFTLGPKEGIEYKYRLEKGANLLYTWTATVKVNYDFHAEPDSGPRGYAESFDKQDGKDKARGAYTAPFSGIHGWYWENLTRNEVRVKLTTAGFYAHAIEFRRDTEPKVRWFE